MLFMSKKKPKIKESQIQGFKYFKAVSKMLESLHEIWVTLLKSLSEDQLNRKFEHPEMKQSFNLKWMIGLYAWHGKHHVAHITSLMDRMNW